MAALLAARLYQGSIYILPDAGTQPQAKTGLREPTGQFRLWRMAVERERLAGLKPIGYLTRGKLVEVLVAVLKAGEVVPLRYPSGESG